MGVADAASILLSSIISVMQFNIKMHIDTMHFTYII
jgi:hypothetical protein